MKALVCEKYGPPDVLEFREVEKPAVGEGEVLVRVLAVAPNMADIHLLTSDIILVRMTEGLFKPKRRSWGPISLDEWKRSGQASRSSNQATRSMAPFRGAAGAVSRSMSARGKTCW